MFSFDFRKHLPRITNVACPKPDTETVTFHVGTDYAMWALITVKPKIMPTSRRNRCPHQSVFGAHIHWNHLPTSTEIRKQVGLPGI